MKDAPQITQKLLETITSIYKRPLMYGVNAGEIDAVLWQYHWLWIYIMERESDDFRDACRLIHGRRHSCNTSFEGHFRRCTKHGAAASEVEAIEFVIRTWKKIDVKLGIPLPLTTE
jgi:hypothetical protein